jgi:hypothetical protein
VVFFHRALEGFDGLVHGVRREKNLCRAAPHHHQARGAGLSLECGDVVLDLLGKIELVLALLHMLAFELFHIFLVEGRLHRAHVLQELAYRLEVARLQHTGLGGRLVGVVGKDVPATENEVLKFFERHELLDGRRAALGALAEADGPHLRERADRLCHAAAHQLGAGDEGGGDGAHPRQQHSEFSFGRRNACRTIHGCGSPCGAAGGASRASVYDWRNCRKQTRYDARFTRLLQIRQTVAIVS